jgi:hypothetical protein
MNQLIEIKDIAQRIIVIRGIKVILDRDLSQLYEVELRVLKQAVRRNLKRFPADFMFELTREENQSLRSQNVILKRGQHPKYMPFAFSEQGVAMISSVLNSEKAIDVNIQIMRAFVQLRQITIEHSQLKREVDELRNQTDERFEIVFAVLDKLVGDDEESSNRKIGFIEPK